MKKLISLFALVSLLVGCSSSSKEVAPEATVPAESMEIPYTPTPEPTPTLDAKDTSTSQEMSKAKKTSKAKKKKTRSKRKKS